MKEYVLDTHIFLSYLTADFGRLSPLVSKIIKGFENDDCIFHIPTISFWEINFKLITNRFKIKGLDEIRSLDIAHQTINNSSHFQDLELTRKAASLAPSFRNKLPDPFDQLIVASALDANLPLITRDINIQKSKLVEIVW